MTEFVRDLAEPHFIETILCSTGKWNTLPQEEQERIRAQPSHEWLMKLRIAKLTASAKENSESFDRTEAECLKTLPASREEMRAYRMELAAHARKRMEALKNRPVVSHVCSKCGLTRKQAGEAKCSVGGGLYHPEQAYAFVITDGSDKQRFVEEIWLMGCCRGWTHSAGCQTAPSEHDFPKSCEIQ